MFAPRRLLDRQLRYLAANLRTPSRLPFQPSRSASSVVYKGPSTRPSLWLRRLLYAGVFGGLGFAAGEWINVKLGAPPIPGTDEDGIELDVIRYLFENDLPTVKNLRNNPDYVESEVYKNYSEEDKAHRLTSGPLRGSRGVALQRVFWNEKEKKAVSVVFLGRGLEGWPGLVHGGALATVVDENMGRAAVRTFPERTGVTANLQINYRAPAKSDDFFEVHTTVDQERSTDRKAYVKSELCNLAGTVCADAAGVFVVPTKLKLQTIGERF